MNGFYKWLAGTKPRMSNHRSPGEERCTEMKDFMFLRKRTRRGNFQSVQHWNCFKHNTWETSGRQRRGQSTKGLSHACKHLVELNLNCMIHQLDHLVECINTGNSAYLVEMFFNAYHQLVLNQVLWAHETVWFDIWYFGLRFFGHLINIAQSGISAQTGNRPSLVSFLTDFWFVFVVVAFLLVSKPYNYTRGGCSIVIVVVQAVSFFPTTIIAQ